MPRNVAPLPPPPRPKQFITDDTAAIAPLATSGRLLGPRDLGGATQPEQVRSFSCAVSTAVELSGRHCTRINPLTCLVCALPVDGATTDRKGSPNFEDGKPRRVPVLKNGKWVTELASEVQSRRPGIPASQSRSLPGRGGGGGGSLHEFELTFEGSVGLGMSLKEHEGATSSGAVPPPGYRVLVGAVAPGSLASQQKLKPGVALIAINGQSLRGLGRKDALRILGMAGKGVRACRFCDFSGVGEAPEQGSSGQAAQQSAHSGGAPGGAAFATGLVQEGGGAGAAGGSGGGGGGAAASAPSGSDGVIEVPPPVDTRSTAARLEKLWA